MLKSQPIESSLADRYGGIIRDLDIVDDELSCIMACSMRAPVFLLFCQQIIRTVLLVDHMEHSTEINEEKIDNADA